MMVSVLMPLLQSAAELSDEDLQLLCNDGRSPDSAKTLGDGLKLWEFWGLPRSAVYEAIRLGTATYLHAVAVKPLQ